MIELVEVTKHYGAIRAIDGVSFEVGRGEALALLGPNGSGKTTTLKCIAGLVRPGAGLIRIAGLNSAEHPLEARASLSYLPQRVTLDGNLTCRELLDFYARLRRVPKRRVDGVLVEWRLESIAKRPVRELSGGTAQRLGVAIAMLPDTPVLLLDEPAASLDPETAVALRDTLRKAKRSGKTILFSSHSLADAEAVADRVAVFVDGRVVALEPASSFRSRMRSDSIEEVYLRYVRANNDSDPACALCERVPARAACGR